MKTNMLGPEMRRRAVLLLKSASTELKQHKAFVLMYKLHGTRYADKYSICVCIAAHIYTCIPMEYLVHPHTYLSIFHMCRYSAAGSRLHAVPLSHD